MNATDFSNILQQPQTITHKQIESVKSVVDSFPYFQPARAIYLKGLKDQSSFKYNQELKTTAAYTTDRSILFDFITSDIFIQNEISESIKQNSSHLKDIEVTIEDVSYNDNIKPNVDIEDEVNTSSNPNIKTDDTLKQQIKDTLGVLDPSLFRPKDSSDETTVEDTETLKEVSFTTNFKDLGKPLVFDKNEKHSFNEWLKLTSIKPIDRTVNETNEEESSETSNSESSLDKAKKFELIDQFITKNPKISPIKSPVTKGNLAKAQMIQPEALMTETLARIYVEQKNYKKAIQSYNILSLKYPEKSGFFANQIKAVKQLQNNNKE